MTKQEVASIQDVIKNAGLNCTKFPKKLEIRIPKAKFPGIYFIIPTNGKTFKLQVYIQQVGIAYIEKLNLRGYTLAGDDMSKTFSLVESKPIPSGDEVTEYLNQALNLVVNIGIVRNADSI